MPRIKVTQTEERNRQRRAVLNDVLSVRGEERNVGNLGKLLGGSTYLGQERYRDPSKLTIEEIRHLKLTDEQIIRLVRGEQPKQEKQIFNIYIDGKRVRVQ